MRDILKVSWKKVFFIIWMFPIVGNLYGLVNYGMDMYLPMTHNNHAIGVGKLYNYPVFISLALLYYAICVRETAKCIVASGVVLSSDGINLYHFNKRICTISDFLFSTKKVDGAFHDTLLIKVQEREISFDLRWAQDWNGDVCLLSNLIADSMAKNDEER